jgi:hypothetical protein
MPVHRALSTRADNVGNDCLWDLRQGDADDNRASPYGRGWRGVLVSTALEFNFLTATLALFTLVGVQECARRRSAIGAARRDSIRAIQAARGSKVITSITSDRPMLSGQISEEAVPLIHEHLVISRSVLARSSRRA